MSKNKIFSILFIIIMFILSAILCVPHEKTIRIIDVISPSKFLLESGEILTLNSIETFDSEFSERNKILAKNIGISEVDAFLLGNIIKSKISNLLVGRKVYVKNNSDFIFSRSSYKERFKYTGFYLENNKPYIKPLFLRNLKSARKANYKVLDLDTDKIYDLKNTEIRKLKNFMLIRKSQISKITLAENNEYPELSLIDKDIKIILTDSTSNLFPHRNCTTNICKTILNNINNAEKTIDIAIYGYSKVPAIEQALTRAQERGVKIRLVYDVDSKGNNIYPDTDKLIKLIQNNTNDGLSTKSQNIMHNKFYIFDNKILITGSANLSHTDMSGFNSNSIVVLNSKEIASIYNNEFEQMYSGKYHTDKKSVIKPKLKISDTTINVFFSPQDKCITNAILPIIKNARSYIYIPTFILSEERVAQELISAKTRGVDVKIIIDAVNASIWHSKHNELRNAGVPVKTENYAGKMHSKTIIVDDKYTIIGSMNFSNSAENKNDENLLVIENPKIAKFYKNFFNYQWNRINEKWLKNSVRAESKDSIGSCSDGIDNNYDGMIDSEDIACR